MTFYQRAYTLKIDTKKIAQRQEYCFFALFVKLCFIY